MPNFKTEDNKGFYKNILFGCLISLVAVLLILLLFAVIMVAVDINPKFASVLSSLALAAGGIIGSRFSSAKNGRKGLIGGLLSGCVLFISLTLAGMLVGRAEFSAISVIHFAIAVLSCCIGGILGVNSAGKRKIV